MLLCARSAGKRKEYFIAYLIPQIQKLNDPNVGCVQLQSPYRVRFFLSHVCVFMFTTGFQTS